MDWPRIRSTIGTRMGRTVSALVIIFVAAALTVVITLTAKSANAPTSSGFDTVGAELPVLANLPDLDCDGSGGRAAMTIDYAYGSTGEPNPRAGAERLAKELALAEHYPGVRPVYSKREKNRQEITWLAPPRKPIAVMYFNRVSDNGWQLGSAEYCSRR